MAWLRLPCLPTSSHDGQCHLRSAVSGQLSVPRMTTNHGFAVSGPTVWNSLPAVLRQYMSLSVFRKWLKTFLMPVTVNMVVHLPFTTPIQIYTIQMTLAIQSF